MKQAYLTIMAELRACGYQCKGEVLNAMYYNVPQSRERVIIIGVRNDLGIQPSHPKPQTRPITVKQAFRGITGSGDAPVLTPRYQAYWHHAKQGETVGKQRSVVKLKLSGVALTLQKSNENGPPYHPTECRAISTLERKRISSFPDSFKCIDRNSAIKCIGNSVPPNLMRAIAEHIRKELLHD